MPVLTITDICDRSYPFGYPNSLIQFQSKMALLWRVTSTASNTDTCVFVFFFLSPILLIGWQLSIWICCRPFSSLLYNYQLLCFWRLALSIAVQVAPRPFFSGYCSFKNVCYKLIMSNCMPYPRVASIFFFF